jgi:hypothetical protein
MRNSSSAALTAVLLLCCTVIGSLATLSAHVVRGLTYPAFATAFVSSPSAGTDSPIPVTWGNQTTGLRVVCFNVANTSPALPSQPDWPRVIGAGFELPGTATGFALVAPLDGRWELLEGAGLAVAGHGAVALDFAILARADASSTTPPGIGPGQPGVRGSGTRFCVSGPFPDTVNGAPATIEALLNGVVVGFTAGAVRDLGVWIDPSRTIPLYP